jgi:hypothetical protein
MAGAKELYAAAEARANTTIKQQEDLNAHTITICQRERVVAEREQELQEKEEEVAGMLDHGRRELSSRKAGLNACEATMETAQQRMGELCVSLLARELDTDHQANNLASRRKELAERERELVDKEKWLAEKQHHELAVTRKRLEELQATRAVEAQKV